MVLAYFAGNDLFDAERFEEFQQSGHAEASALGMADQRRVRPRRYLVRDKRPVRERQLARASPAAVRRQRRHGGAAAGTRSSPRAHLSTAASSALVQGRLLQWALMPPYLNTLNFSERELRARRGWRLTRDAILAMQHVSRVAGADFTVMFLPFKSQVYWPPLERSCHRR